MKRGTKRLILTCLLIATPFASAQTISTLDTAAAGRLQPALEAPLRKALPELSRSPAPAYGIASWYSHTDPGINVHTANGEVFRDSQMTCASWNYAFGTYLRVTNAANGRYVICRVNDRGPARHLNRLIDLTKSAFGEIADPHLGLIEVDVQPQPGTLPHQNTRRAHPPQSR